MVLQIQLDAMIHDEETRETKRTHVAYRVCTPANYPLAPKSCDNKICSTFYSIRCIEPLLHIDRVNKNKTKLKHNMYKTLTITHINKNESNYRIIETNCESKEQ